MYIEEREEKESVEPMYSRIERDCEDSESVKRNVDSW